MADVPTASEVAHLEAEWRRLEGRRLTGRLRAYQRWQKAVDQRRDGDRGQKTTDANE
jgi:hypothetical protein